MRWASFNVLWLVLLLASPSWASSRVVLLEPTDATGALRDALARTRAELESEGFEVVVRPFQGTEDPRRALEAAALEADAKAAIVIQSLARGADVWVTDRITGKTSVRRVDVGDQPIAERPRALAIRAVELLRASLVEAVALPPSESTAGAEPLPRDLREFVEAEGAPWQGFSGELSVAMVTGFDSIGPFAGPAARLGYGLDGGLFMRVAWAGPLFGATLEGPLGRATLRQETLTFDVGYAPALDWGGFVPMAWAGIGFHHLTARGDLVPGVLAQTDDVWSLALHAGVGLGYRLTPRVMLALDSALVFLLPRPTVTMAGERIASTGRPSLASTLGVVVRF